MSSPKPDDYVVGWICALRVEFEAARDFADEIYDESETKHIGPDPTTGTPQKAIKGMVQGFPKIKLVLAVGVGGGAPTQRDALQIGDVVVGLARGANKSVFTYDIVTLESGQFESTKAFDPPCSISATSIGSLEGYCRLPDRLLEKQLLLQPQFTEGIYKSDVVCPKADQPCSNVSETDTSQLVHRRKREGYEGAVLVRYGTIASSSTPVEDASTRNILATKANVLCFETEAYGLLKELPCLVIRGIADHADSYKPVDWERYAAETASLYAHNLLRLLPRGAFDLQSAQKPSRFFRLGRCFVTRWVEPMSQRSRNRASAPTIPAIDLNDGVFTEMRRYIVVREGHHSSWCVPIHTYEGRGTAKPDIKLCDHAKIYRFGDADPHSEFPLRKPIGIVVEGEDELHQLDPASLANFGKIYTIEHDVPIINIGYVPRLHVNRLILDLNALEISTPVMKYQRLRRDEGPVNIRLGGKEKLQIDELDMGTEGSANIVVSGESCATIHKLKGRDGPLRVTATAQGTLELGTVAVNGQIAISLSGKSRVTVQKLYGYRGILVATITDEATLTMKDVSLESGSFALALSHNSVSAITRLHIDDGYFMARSDMKAMLWITDAKFVKSIVNTNTNGPSQPSTEIPHNPGNSFIPRTNDGSKVDINQLLVDNCAVNVMIGANSEFTVHNPKGSNTSLSGLTSRCGKLDIPDCEGIFKYIIEKNEQLSQESRERGELGNMSQSDPNPIHNG
ncbi:hypothetical protein EKO27_g5927 [Xylaria grammica]|uniref:DUF6590 domain-containing protein n=1 Tax=Xylaria grammica TaxID=363999 RepID=A0A439D457_9PEZI|nr:hypothetical protein EKO27_g5927 [Xylaria grammica]